MRSRRAERAAFAISPEVGAELIDALDGESTQPPERRRAVASEARGTYALTVVLRHVVGPPEYLGALSIARRGRPFDRTEAELLEYLAGQAVVSIENANLHETVERQAVTDELTGLANVRAFWAILRRELERNRRFGSSLGLVMIDIDDFKQVNDRHGHQQGDEVLAQVAEILRRLSRDIDAPARYGGEELAVILPETELEWRRSARGAHARSGRGSTGPGCARQRRPAGHGELRSGRRARERGRGRGPRGRCRRGAVSREAGWQEPRRSCSALRRGRPEWPSRNRPRRLGKVPPDGRTR